MIRFKFVATGVDIRIVKNSWAHRWKELPYQFTLDDIQKGMFSQSVMKRLQSATKDGTLIRVMKGKRYSISIAVINKEDKNKKAVIKRKLQTRYNQLLKNDLVQEFLDIGFELGYNKSK